MNTPTVILKIGTALLVNADGSLRESVLDHVVEGLVYLQKKGFAPILVTSGAVAAGKSVRGGMKCSKGTLAALGQPILMNTYSKKGLKSHISMAQYLITREDVSDRKRYICLKASLEEACNAGIIPIINDNDVLHEARESFSDNDQLACYLAVMMESEKVVLMTSVDGIYENFGTEDQKKIEYIRDEFVFDGVDTNGKTESGTGGMKGKIDSLRLPMRHGIDVFVGKGDEKNIFTSLFEESGPYTKIEGCTSGKKLKGVKKWLFAGAEPKGALQMSEKGGVILKNKSARKSVLLRGVEQVEGDFFTGDVVRVVCEDGEEIGYGVVKMSSQDISSHKGEENRVVIHADYFLVK